MKKYLALLMFALMFGLVLIPTTTKATGVSVDVRAETIDVSSDLNITYKYGSYSSVALTLHNGEAGWLVIYIVNQLSNDTHKWFVIKEFRGKADWNTTWRMINESNSMGGNIISPYILYGHKKYYHNGLEVPIVGYDLYPPEHVLNGVHKFYTMMIFTLYGDGWGDMANKTLGVVNTTFTLYVHSPYHSPVEGGSGGGSDILLYVGIGVAIVVVAVAVIMALLMRRQRQTN